MLPKVIVQHGRKDPAWFKDVAPPGSSKLPFPMTLLPVKAEAGQLAVPPGLLVPVTVPFALVAGAPAGSPVPLVRVQVPVKVLPSGDEKVMVPVPWLFVQVPTKIMVIFIVTVPVREPPLGSVPVRVVPV